MNVRTLVSTLLSVSTLAAAMSHVSTARADTPYHPGDGIPYGYHVENKWHSGLIIGGAVTFGATYSVAAVAGATDESLRAFFIPVGGALYEGKEVLRDCGHSVIGPFACIGGGLLILDSIGQATGLVLLTVGLASGEEQRLVENKTASLRVAPTPMPGGGGLIATGTF
jgi:hypothetical protein